MRAEVTDNCGIFFDQIEQEGGLRKAIFLAMLRRLYVMESEPEEDSPSMKRVRQAKRHRLWRLAHPYKEGVAVRLVVWFPPGQDKAVVALAAFDKARIGDIWYDTATKTAEATVDQLLRTGPVG